MHNSAGTKIFIVDRHLKKTGKISALFFNSATEIFFTAIFFLIVGRAIEDFSVILASSAKIQLKIFNALAQVRKIRQADR